MASYIKGKLAKDEKVIYTDPANITLFSLLGLIIIGFLILPIFGIGLIFWLVLHKLRPKERVMEIILTVFATIIVVATGALDDVPWRFWPFVPIVCYLGIDIWLWLSRKYIEWAGKVNRPDSEDTVQG